MIATAINRNSTWPRPAGLLGGLLRGALAGAAGTAAMDLAQYARYRSGGGQDRFADWEFHGVSDWEHAPAPAQVGRRAARLAGRELPDQAANRVNNVVHWTYGIAWAAAAGAVVALTGRRRRPWWGPVHGTAVWLSDYVTLPLLGLYQPIWRYDAKTLARDWADHATYGTVAGLAYRLLAVP